MQPWLLVSPASKGIGFCMARHLLKTTNAPVVVTARNDLDGTKRKIMDGLSEVDDKRLKALHLDFLDEKSIMEASKECKSTFPIEDNLLHLAYVIPGILFPEKSPEKVDYEKALLTFQTNTLGPLMFTKHFFQFLPQKSIKMDASSEAWKGLDSKLARWIFMSARVGSVTDNKKGGWYSYRSSKSAINQITKSFDLHVKTKSGDNAMAIAMHPGTVKTGLSKEFWDSVPKDRLLEPEDSAERLIGLCTKSDGVGLDGRGRIWDWQGKEIEP
ncbi:short-chain dehydrogenase/reductase-like protein [Microthyrium microscopicum]|uniref:Short-chain dehydrogenase/reductase-like protein n=1 Tax=Microthyrium microscopicum TaxID=703497 RepID=A0A6A6UJG7_9PEZI|nr:short-chain dehydrogenase/reductase-like protein [Microthyrium microscopicum]